MIFLRILLMISTIGCLVGAIINIIMGNELAYFGFFILGAVLWIVAVLEEINEKLSVRRR